MPPTQGQYNGQIHYLERWLHSSQHLRPIKRTITLRFDNHSIAVVTFNFTAQLLSLFQDLSLNRMENLVVNRTDPFRRYDPPSGHLGEINSGENYAIAYENMIQRKIFFVLLLCTWTKPRCQCNPKSVVTLSCSRQCCSIGVYATNRLVGGYLATFQ